MKSVAEQTHKPAAHLVGVDFARIGGARMKNALAERVDTEWIAILDDDDYLYPQHLQRLIESSADADVVYSYCDSPGDCFTSYNRPWGGPDSVRGASIVSHNALVRTSVFKDAGCFSLQRGYDWWLWRTIADAGGRFVSVPERTWFYDLDSSRYHESRS
jgi:glycosyltransferase involved in cell wall biosynthesis